MSVGDNDYYCPICKRHVDSNGNCPVCNHRERDKMKKRIMLRLEMSDDKSGDGTLVLSEEIEGIWCELIFTDVQNEQVERLQNLTGKYVKKG